MSDTTKTAKAEAKEPIVRIAKRDDISFLHALLVRIIAVIFALGVCSVVIYIIAKVNPADVFTTMVDKNFGTDSIKRTMASFADRGFMGQVEGFFKGLISSRRLWITIRDTMILLCVSLALTPAFKMKFWNIGGEGQILVGGLVTAIFMMFMGGKLSTPVLFIGMIVGSCLAGMVWGLVPALFKAKWNTNETLFTLMMNYIAIQLVAYCNIIWEAKKGSGTISVINLKGQYGWFPTDILSGIFGNTNYFLTFLIIMLLTVFSYVYMSYSKQGYEINVVGESQNTAKYAGINVKKVIVRTMAISGAICGFAGFLLVSGSSHTISSSTSDGRGFTAIIVAWLSKFNPFVMILVSFMLVFLDSGASEVATRCGLTESASEVLTGIILFFILGCEFFINYRLIFRTKHKEVK